MKLGIVVLFGKFFGQSLGSFRTTSEVEFWASGLDQMVEEDSEVEVKMPEMVGAIFSSTKSKAACQACKVGVRTLRKLAKRGKARSILISSIKKLCKTLANQSNSVCKGIAHSSGSEVFDIVERMKHLDPTTEEVMCYAFANVCPMPVIKLEQLRLPQRTGGPIRPKETAVKHILHLSDIHFDREYVQGEEADCNKPICCQKDSNSDTTSMKTKSPARKWGEYKCDANFDLINSLLKNAAAKHKYDMVFFTGDIPAHDMWKETASRSEETATNVYGLLKEHFPSSTIYPAIGNHEPAPLNQFPFESNTRLYNFTAEKWRGFVPEPQLANVKKGGYYAIDHSETLRVLVLNNNLYYTYNYHAFLAINNKDPQGMLQWLINQLQDAETKGIKVYIASHIPPGSTDFYQHWSESYHRIIIRYKETIAAQFYGHLHTDEFQVFYESDKKSSETAVNVAYLAPSMSTLDGINPSFRVYETINSQVVDYKQYYANLHNQNLWSSDATWELLYSASKTYSLPGTTQSSLPPKFWHQATTLMARNATLFGEYWSLRKARGELGECNAECRDQTICSLRAAKSKDNCAKVVPFS